MLTGDLNVIDVQWIVQYRIEDPIRYLFRVREHAADDPRHRRGGHAPGRRQPPGERRPHRRACGRFHEVKDEMQKILTAYETGVRLVTVELQDVTPPDPVKPAFNEVNEARQDRERTINEAQEQGQPGNSQGPGRGDPNHHRGRGLCPRAGQPGQWRGHRFAAVLDRVPARSGGDSPPSLPGGHRAAILPEAKAMYIVDSDQKALVPWLPMESGAASRRAEGRSHEEGLKCARVSWSLAILLVALRAPSTARGGPAGRHPPVRPARRRAGDGGGSALQDSPSSRTCAASRSAFSSGTGSEPDPDQGAGVHLGRHDGALADRRREEVSRERGHGGRSPVPPGRHHRFRRQGPGLRPASW